MDEYEIQVRNIFEAESFEDAVQQMVCWLQENAAFAGYRVFNLETGAETFIDAERLQYDEYGMELEI